MKKIIVLHKGNQEKNNINTSNNNNNSSNYINIQFENKKNLFLSRIKKEHSINFKKKDSTNNSNVSRIYPIKNKENKNINYMEYNIQNTARNNEDSLNKNIKSFSSNKINYRNSKRNNVLTTSNSQNNYNNVLNIYNLNKSKTSTKNNHSSNSVKYNQKLLYNDENIGLNKEEISLYNSCKKSNNGNLVFNQNFIGMKNLKHNYCISNDANMNLKYYKKKIAKMDIYSLTSNESSFMNNE